MLILSLLNNAKQFVRVEFKKKIILPYTFLLFHMKFLNFLFKKKIVLGIFSMYLSLPNKVLFTFFF